MSNNEENRNQPATEDTNMTEAPTHQETGDNRDQPQDHQDGATQTPWNPDRQDTVNAADFLANLQPGATRGQVMEALQRQIESLDATITDLATGDNQDRFVHVTQQRDILNERLTTLRRIHNQNTNETTGTRANNTNSQDALVPRHLPAFQFFGGVRHAKNKARYDSAQSFLEEFRTVLEGHSLNIEQHWRRLMPLTVNSNSRAWLRELMGKEGVNDWSTFCQEIIKQYSPPYTMFYRRNHLRTMRQKSTESLRQYSTKFQEYAVKTGIANNQELVFNYLC